MTEVQSAVQTAHAHKLPAPPPIQCQLLFSQHLSVVMASSSSHSSTASIAEGSSAGRPRKKRAKQNKRYYYCEHCKEDISKTLYFQHRKLFYDPKLNLWQSGSSIEDHQQLQNESDFSFNSESSEEECKLELVTPHFLALPIF